MTVDILIMVAGTEPGGAVGATPVATGAAILSLDGATAGTEEAGRAELTGEAEASGTATLLLDSGAANNDEAGEPELSRGVEATGAAKLASADASVGLDRANGVEIAGAGVGQSVMVVGTAVMMAGFSPT